MQEINILSKYLQTSSINYAYVLIMTENTKSTLKELRSDSKFHETLSKA